MRIQIRFPEPLRAYYFAHKVPLLGILYGAGILGLTCLFGALLTVGSGSSASSETREANWKRELESARARSRSEATARAPARPLVLRPEPSSALGVRDYVVQVRDGAVAPEPDPFIPPELTGAAPAGIDDAAALVDDTEPPPDPSLDGGGGALIEPGPGGEPQPDSGETLDDELMDSETYDSASGEG